MLLTDEELWEVDKTIPDFTKEDREDPWYCERYYLKAQLKKVVEWLEQYHIKVLEGDPSDIPAVFSDCGYHIPTNVVQFLLKEVE